MDKRKMFGDTPIKTDKIVNGNHYFINLQNGDMLFGVLKNSTVLSLTFNIILKNDEFCAGIKLEVPVIDVVEERVRIYHINARVDDIIFNACMKRYGVVKMNVPEGRRKFDELVNIHVITWIAPYINRAFILCGYDFTVKKDNITFWVISDNVEVRTLCVQYNGHDWVIHNNCNNPVFKINPNGYKIYASTMAYEKGGFTRNEINMLIDILKETLYKEGETNEGVSE